jgi:hypothetical protein
MANMLSRETMVPIGLVIQTIALVAALVVGYTRITARLDDLEARQAISYTIAQASEDSLRNAIANPGVRFSDPRHPGQYICVTMSAVDGDRP